MRMLICIIYTDDSTFC